MAILLQMFERNLIKRSRVLWLAESLVHELELELKWNRAYDEVTARLIKEVTLLIGVWVLLHVRAFLLGRTYESKVNSLCQPTDLESVFNVWVL